MGLFDGLSSSRGVSFGTQLAVEGKTPSQKGETKPIKTLANENVIAKRVDTLKKHQLAMEEAAKKRALSRESSVFPGMKPAGSGTGTKMSSTFESKPAVAAEINRAKTIFMENLTNALFIGQINIINCESCPIDEKIKEYIPADGSTPGYKETTYEMCLSMFQDVRNSKDFDKVVEEGNVPGFVGELWSLARETAELEANIRFNFETVFEATGYETDKLQNYLQNEIDGLYVKNESANEYFQHQSAIIIMENEDVIDQIKGKVNAEIDNYKSAAQHIADIKKSVRTKLDDADSVDGANGKPDEDPNSDDKPDNKESTNGDNSGGTSDSSQDNSGNAENTDGDNSDKTNPENSDQNGEKSSENDDENNSQGSSSEKPKSADSGDNSAADNTDPEKKDGDKPQTNEGEDLLENQEQLRQISPKVTQEIEDAATFAGSWSHTFNTGDEKFEALRKRFSQDLVTALNNNNLEALPEIQANVDATKARIDKLNADTDGKYTDLQKRFAALQDQVKFEYGRRVKKTVKVAEESRTVFENLVLSIAKRKINSGMVTVENGEPQFDYNTSEATMNEAIINQTALETFNTLRLIDSRNKVDLENTLQFFKDIRN